MRLCFFGLTLTFRGGAENLSVNLISQLLHCNDVDEIFVICEGIDEEAYKVLRHKKVNICRIGCPERVDPVRILVRNIQNRHLSDELHRFDIFHVLDDRAFPFLNLDLRPLVVTVHDVMMDECLIRLKNIGLNGIRDISSIISHYPPQFFLEFISAVRASVIVANCSIIAQRLERIYGDIVDGKIRVLPAGFDPKRFNPYLTDKSTARRLLNLDSSTKVLLHVGGDKERKGLPYLIYALEFMHKTGELDRQDIQLLVVGKVGEKHKQSFSIIKEHIIELPLVTEDVLPMVYRAADVFVMPSISEGWGIALVESLACGTPVVASTHVPSAIATESTGAVRIEQEIQNAPKLANSILKVLNDNSSQVKDWNKIFDYLELNYSWENYATTLLRDYRELISLSASNARIPWMPRELGFKLA